MIRALSLAAALALAACPSRTSTPEAARSPTPPAEATAPVKGAPPAAETPEECLDRVLREAGLNRYGDPADMMYAGGTPLFDEASGRTIDRREYVRERRPDLLERCPDK